MFGMVTAVNPFSLTEGGVVQQRSINAFWADTAFIRKSG
jgi:hypothetical protein